MPRTKTRGEGEASGTSRRVERVRRLLLRRARPRVLMSLILAATGAAGFLVSFALLHMGVARMWLRYPLAVLAAYGVFLLLLRIWLHLQRRSWTDLLPDDLNLLNFDSPSAGFNSGGGFSFGGGGEFGGAGAGGAWDGSISNAASAPVRLAGHANSSGSTSGGIADGILG